MFRAFRGKIRVFRVFRGKIRIFRVFRGKIRVFRVFRGKIRAIRGVECAVIPTLSCGFASSGMMNGQAIAMPSAVDRRDEDAAARVGALFDAHHRRLLTLARRLCAVPEDARDVVQETFLRAARSPDSIPAGAPNEEAWLVRVMINICRDRWRQSAVRARARVSGGRL